jgi:hypothetical protein
MMKKYDGHYIHMPWADIAILVVYPLSFFPCPPDTPESGIRSTGQGKMFGQKDSSC